MTGPFTEDDLGVACYHSKVGTAGLLLKHLVAGPGECVVVDMSAGADSFASNCSPGSTALAGIRAEFDGTVQDWVEYQAVEFHLRNTRAWADERTVEDLTEQVDPNFVPGPRPSAAVR